MFQFLYPILQVNHWQMMQMQIMQTYASLLLSDQVRTWDPFFAFMRVAPFPPLCCSHLRSKRRPTQFAHARTPSETSGAHFANDGITIEDESNRETETISRLSKSMKILWKESHSSPISHFNEFGYSLCDPTFSSVSLAWIMACRLQRRCKVHQSKSH